MNNVKFLTLIFILITVGIIGGYSVLNSVFPKSPPIRLPESEEVIAVHISENQQNSVELETTKIEPLLTEIGKAVPIRTMSVNDYPTVKPYYLISIQCCNNTYYYFIYTENNQTYIEMPYEGIYKADSRIYSIISIKP